MAPTLLYGRAMKTILALTTLSLLTTAGCKKDDKKSAEPGAEKVSDTGKPAAKDTGPFAAWDLAGRKQAFQGAMVAPGDAIGQWEAWEVSGDSIKSWDGTAEKTRTLTIPSPCEAKVTETSSDGSSSSVTHHFTLKDGAVVTGLGDAGSRRGAEAVACVSNAVFTVDAKGVCTEWEQDMFDDTKWTSKPGTCGFAKDGDQEVFKATVHDHETVLQVDGDTIWSEQLAREHSEQAADFAAAKTARDARK